MLLTTQTDTVHPPVNLELIYSRNQRVQAGDDGVLISESAVSAADQILQSSHATYLGTHLGRYPKLPPHFRSFKGHSLNCSRFEARL